MGNALRIPSPTEVQNEIQQSFNSNPNGGETGTPPQIKEPIEQIPLKLDSTDRKFRQTLGTLLDRLKYRRDEIKLSQLWNSPAFAFAIVTFLLNILTVVIGGIIQFNSLPSKINIFYDSVEGNWILLDKSAIFILPILYLTLFVTLLRIIILLAQKDKNFANAISWIITYLQVMLFITVGNIFRLIT